MHIKNKIVLLTGGANRTGFACAKELLRNGAAHVAILDVEKSNGEGAVERLEVEFGEGRTSFLICDVTKPEEFKAAFRKIVDKFSRLDIVINNTDIVNDIEWEVMINTTLNTVIRGTILGLEHMGKENGGSGGIIVNIASTAGVDPFYACPIYCATKHAVVGLSRSFGTPYHYAKSGVRILVLCPGLSETSMMTRIFESESVMVERKLCIATTKATSLQEMDCVAQGLIFIIRSGENGSVWIAEGGEPIYEISIPNYLAIKAS